MIKTFPSLITMAFPFYSLIAMEEYDAHKPFVRNTMVYTFNEEGKRIGTEIEDDTLEPKNPRRIASNIGKRDEVGTFLATNPIIFCCPCVICILIPYCIGETCMNENEMMTWSEFQDIEQRNKNDEETKA